jgi:hypothetical protein
VKPKVRIASTLPVCSPYSTLSDLPVWAADIMHSLNRLQGAAPHGFLLSSSSSSSHLINCNQWTRLPTTTGQWSLTKTPGSTRLPPPTSLLGMRVRHAHHCPCFAVSAPLPQGSRKRSWASCASPNLTTWQVYFNVCLLFANEPALQHAAHAYPTRRRINHGSAQSPVL